mmetsp:Transcript_26035/g.67283  ORF Transcript_26035/g.67283 Transcript_26035/m.67283 type:complete len:213 (+) Transcript_26035:91-729(+)
MGGAASVTAGLFRPPRGGRRANKYRAHGTGETSGDEPPKDAVAAAAQRAREQEAEEDASAPQKASKARSPPGSSDEVQALNWAPQGPHGDRTSPLGIDELVSADELDDALAKPGKERGAGSGVRSSTQQRGGIVGWAPPQDSKGAHRGPKGTLVVDQHVVGSKSPKKTPTSAGRHSGDGTILLSSSALRGLQPQEAPVEPMLVQECSGDDGD